MIENNSDSRFIDCDQRNNPLMTLKTLKFYCQKQSLPSQPELNQTLYLQYKGFQKIVPETISCYMNLKNLHLNNNGITKIQGLHLLRQLNVLNLNNNFIQKIQGLQQLANLKVLNLSHNKIDYVQGLQGLNNLKTLNLGENFFTKAKDIEGLITLVNLNQLNLSKNQLNATQDVFEVLTQLQNLTILYLKQTPLSNSLKNYRKRMIYHLKNLKFLDNRPVLPKDHQLAEAWNQGGIEKEKQLKSKIIQEKKQQEIMLQTNNKVNIQQSFFESSEQDSLRSRQKYLNVQQIFYQKSDKPANQQGLNSAYLPKKMTKLDEFLQKDTSNINQKQNKEIIAYHRQTQNIYQRVQQVLNNGKPVSQQQQQHQRMKKSINKKWSKKYQKILQELLMKYKFDFSQVQPSMNMIITNINKKLMKSAVRFQINQLRYIWTQIEKEKRKVQLTKKNQDKKVQIIQV